MPESNEYPLSPLDSGKGEQRLIQRAIRLGWDISPKQMRAVAAATLRDAIDPNVSAKLRAANRRTIVAMQAQNIRLTQFMEDDDKVPEAAVVEGQFKKTIDDMPIEDRRKLLEIFRKQQVGQKKSTAAPVPSESE
jgi:hypothetical protein